jgi:hypothetical protein
VLRETRAVTSIASKNGTCEKNKKKYVKNKAVKISKSIRNTE